MNKFFLPIKKDDPDKSKVPSEEIQESINPFHREMNTSEGSEFLDDAIRTKEQPFGNTGVKENMDPMEELRMHTPRFNSKI